MLATAVLTLVFGVRIPEPPGPEKKAPLAQSAREGLAWLLFLIIATAGVLVCLIFRKGKRLWRLEEE